MEMPEDRQALAAVVRVLLGTLTTEELVSIFHNLPSQDLRWAGSLEAEMQPTHLKVEALSQCPGSMVALALQTQVVVAAVHTTAEEAL
jgi:hypothetical protein